MENLYKIGTAASSGQMGFSPWHTANTGGLFLLSAKEPQEISQKINMLPTASDSRPKILFFSRPLNNKLPFRPLQLN